MSLLDFPVPALALDRPVPEPSRLVDVDGTVLNIATTPGAPGRPPLVLYNGIGANLELLESFVRALDPRIPTLRFDVPGIGGSPQRTKPYRFSGLARTVGKLCDQLGYGEVDVFGISWGGAAAQEFMHQHPQRCRRAVLAATSMGMFMLPASPKVLLRMVSPRRYWDRKYLEQAAPVIYGGDFRTHPERIREMTGRIRRSGLLGYVYQLFAGLWWTSLWWIWRLRQPVLLLAGSDDPLIPSLNPRVMAKLLRHSRLQMYDCGHLFLFTRETRVAADVSEFLLAPKAA